jgi:hypothetical protein
MEFREFLNRWGINHKTSSPYYSQSNGIAEAGVKQIKKLIRGAWNKSTNMLNWDLFAESVLLYCNTPRHNGFSPSELLFGHMIKDTLPAHRRSFTQQQQSKCDEIEIKAAEKRDKMDTNYNRSSNDLPILPVGTPIVLQDTRSKKWDKYGVVVEIGPNRDYLVKLVSGRLFRRNRRFIRR